jgi:hypothetical protein
MTRLSYTKAIDEVLRPAGFERDGKQWTRIRGEMKEQLDLQKSSVDGSVTVNVWAKNLETDRILRSIPCDAEMGIIQFGVRIGDLIDGQDRWWRNDPNGPAELAQAVRTYALPWYDQFSTLKDQAAKQYARGGARPWRNPSIPPLAVTLYRLGEIDEALALFDAPVPNTAIPNLVAKCKCVQRWLQEQHSKTL